jgi:arabinose-5-phosphate isomerase
MTKQVLSLAREVFETESHAIAGLVDHLDDSFTAVVDLLVNCSGRAVLSGMGKAGLIADKVSATLSSTGTPSFFLHPAEALHGDLGRLRPEDICIVFSNSGESDEVVRLLGPLKSIGVAVVAITGRPDSSLASHADYHLFIGSMQEACPMGLAPTTSTTVMLAMGDALAVCTLQGRNFQREDYARFHPGGSLGRSLMRVHEIMRRDEEVTLVDEATTAHETLLAMNGTKGRPGAAMITDANGRLVGFITDGDLVRALEHGTDFLHEPITQMMIADPKQIHPDQLAMEALRLLREHKIDQLAVIDSDQKPVGLIDIQDLVSTGMGQ